MTEERATRMLLRVAVFILLSARTIAEERRCYWCGPLAEQVHRSQRAPPCDPFGQHQTVCDAGYTHCAIVATSPPYAESRLCVKFYQDECYSLYCNSTRTWRMVCPCRGDLCNGANSEREISAFSTLVKIVAKTKRNKRELPKEKSSFFNIRTTRDNSTTTNKTKLANAIDAQGERQPTEIIFKNATTSNNVSKRYNDETIIEHGITQSLKNDDNAMSSITTTMPTTVDVSKDKYEATTPVDVKVTQPSSEMTTTMKPTSVQVQLAVVNKDNVKDNMPPAEALQHNETPKATEHTTMGTVEISTMENLAPTKETNQTKNFATHNILHLFTLISSIIMHL